MNNSGSSRFSIIIPVYDRKDYVKKAVTSCLNQNYNKQNIEIIVVKNFADYDLEKWLCQRSILYIDSEKLNLVDKLIEGISISNGDIICLLEDDDEFIIDKLKILDKYYKKFPDISSLHNNFKYMEEKGYNIDKFYLNHMKMLGGITLLKDDEEKLSLIKYKDVYHNLSCWSFRRDYAFELLKDLSGLTYNIDFLIYCEIIEKNAEILILSEKLTVYRRHNSATRMNLDYQKMINFFKCSIFSYQTVQNKISNQKLKSFIKSNIGIEQFKINIIEEKFPSIKDIKDSLVMMIYPPYKNIELYSFLFLYLPLGIFRQFRKHLYINHAYLLN